MFEVDLVFEESVIEQLDLRLLADDRIGLQADIAVADVLGHQRYQHVFTDIPRSAREAVEEDEKRALAAMGQGDISTAERPTIALPKKLRQHFQESGPALRRIVIRQSIEQFAGLLQLLQHPFEHRGHSGNGRRITAAQHHHAGLRQSRAQIVHQVGNTRVAVEMLAEI